MNIDDVKKLENAAVAKWNLLSSDLIQYLFRAIMAGFFIDMAMIFSNVVANVFRGSSPEWGRFLAAIAFSIAVLLICLVGGELFTGNNLVLAFGAYRKRVTPSQVGLVWLVSYLGNFIGCFILSVLFVLSGASGTGEYYGAFIPGKLSLPAGEMFCRAVLCNFFVCMGVLCGIKLQNEVAKILMICFCISAFVISGFEHSIANMGNFVAAAFLVPGLSFPAILRSMAIVTAGNIVGGGLLLAWPLHKMSAVN
ncbi:MAG: formate/nitrite transporter family protein [Blautia sp.]|nr:formate/nitrite transporter family protein [Blautia sp.]